MQKQISFTNGVQVESDSRGIVMFPSDLGIDVNTATRDWLAVIGRSVAGTFRTSPI